MWDIHNHMLMDLDDGASCLEETMDMLEDAYNQGIRNLICTPHYRIGMFEADEEHRIYAYRWVKELSEKKYPDLKLYLGCELHMHLVDDEKLEKPIYHMPGDKVVLAEFSGNDSIRTIRRLLRPLLRKGYRCIIAHVERYPLTKEEIKTLHDIDGVFLQVNADSILGNMGFRRKLFVWKLLKENLVDFIGSDAHNTDQRANQMGKCFDKVKKKLGKDRAMEIFRYHPEQLFL